MPTSRAGRTASRPGWQPLANARGSEAPTRPYALLLNRDRKGAVAPESGVTLLELLIVMVLIAVIAAVSFPTASAGLDSLRLRSAADRVMSLLNLALDRAERVQEVVEIRISPQENAISARSVDLSLNRTLELQLPVRIASVGSSLAGPAPQGDAAPPEQQRRFLLYPGGTPPRISIELETKDGRKRRVSVDPVTGMLHSEVENQ